MKENVSGCFFFWTQCRNWVSDARRGSGAFC